MKYSTSASTREIKRASGSLENWVADTEPKLSNRGLNVLKGIVGNFSILLKEFGLLTSISQLLLQYRPKIEDLPFPKDKGKD